MQSGGSWGRSPLKGSSFTCHSCHLDLSWGYWPEHLHTASLCGLGFLIAQQLGSKRKLPERRAWQTLQNLAMIQQHYLCLILFIKSKFLCPVHSKGEGNWTLPLDRKSIKEFADIFKTSTKTKRSPGETQAPENLWNIDYEGYAGSPTMCGNGSQMILTKGRMTSEARGLWGTQGMLPVHLSDIPSKQ